MENISSILRQKNINISDLKASYMLPHGGIINSNKGFFVKEKTLTGARNNLTHYQHAINDTCNMYEQTRDKLTHNTQIILDQHFDFLLTESQMFESAFMIEAEKEGLIVLDKPTRKRLNEEVSAHETKLYGPSISSQKQEVAIILDTLTTLQSSPQLSHTQKDTLQTYINQQTNTHKITTHRQTQTSHTNTPEGKTIPPTIVKQIFEYVFDFYEEVEENFHKRTVKIGPYPNMSVSWEKRELRMPQQGVKLKRVFELIAHEIENHAIQGEAGRHNIGFAVGNYLKDEEGLSLLQEQAVTRDLDALDYTPTIHHITTFMGETLTGESLKNMLTIYFTTQRYSGTLLHEKVEKRYHRIKRFHSHEIRNSNRKGVSYWRGFLEVASLIQSEGINNEKVHKIFTGKAPLHTKTQTKESYSIIPHRIARYLYRSLYEMDQGDTTLNTTKITYQQKTILYKLLQITKPYI